MARLFFSYSHRDEELRDQLQTHLTILERQGLIETWHDRRILAGDHVDQTIDAEIDLADIILFLVSPDFLASAYINDVEIARALQRHGAGDARVIPVILRPCDWQYTAFGRLNAAPKDGKPITKWPDRDEAFQSVVSAIRVVVEVRKAGSVPQRQSSPPPPVPTPPSERVVVSRSSNLSIAKDYSQKDRDDFLDKAYEFIVNFFESSLQELQQRVPEVETRFKSIDRTRCTATAYRKGRSETACTIFLDATYGGGIGYSSNDHGRIDTFNEQLRVEHDSQSLWLKPWMNSSGRDAKLSFEGAAELLWKLFMEPLQRARR